MYVFAIYIGTNMHQTSTHPTQHTTLLYQEKIQHKNIVTCLN